MIRKAEAEWNGNLIHGSGRLTVGSGALNVPYSLRSRLEDGQSATNPEELLGAAHAGCFTMALTGLLSASGFAPTSVHTVAKVTFEKVGDAFSIIRIALDTSAQVPDIDDATFQRYAADAKQTARCRRRWPRPPSASTQRSRARQMRTRDLIRARRAVTPRHAPAAHQRRRR